MPREQDLSEQFVQLVLEYIAKNGDVTEHRRAHELLRQFPSDRKQGTNIEEEIQEELQTPCEDVSAPSALDIDGITTEVPSENVEVSETVPE